MQHCVSLSGANLILFRKSLKRQSGCGTIIEDIQPSCVTPDVLTMFNRSAAAVCSAHRRKVMKKLNKVALLIATAALATAAGAQEIHNWRSAAGGLAMRGRLLTATSGGPQSIPNSAGSTLAAGPTWPATGPTTKRTLPCNGPWRAKQRHWPRSRRQSDAIFRSQGGRGFRRIPLAC